MNQQTQTTLTPHLVCSNTIEAIEFYKTAFGAETLSIMKAPDGNVLHAAININGATVYFTDESPAYGLLGPKALGGTPVTLHLQVPDSDAVFNRAVHAGCEVRLPLQDMFWGDRYAQIVDPFGHQWSIASTVKQLSPEEMHEAMLQAMTKFGNGEGCPAVAETVTA